MADDNNTEEEGGGLFDEPSAPLTSTQETKTKKKKVSGLTYLIARPRIEGLLYMHCLLVHEMSHS